jgi:hypothetical protein
MTSQAFSAALLCKHGVSRRIDFAPCPVLSRAPMSIHSTEVIALASAMRSLHRLRLTIYTPLQIPFLPKRKAAVRAVPAVLNSIDTCVS